MGEEKTVEIIQPRQVAKRNPVPGLPRYARYLPKEMATRFQDIMDELGSLAPERALVAWAIEENLQAYIRGEMDVRTFSESIAAMAEGARRIDETEHRILTDRQNVFDEKDVRFLMRSVAATINRHVDNPVIRQNIGLDLDRILKGRINMLGQPESMLNDDAVDDDVEKTVMNVWGALGET